MNKYLGNQGRALQLGQTPSQALLQGGSGLQLGSTSGLQGAAGLQLGLGQQQPTTGGLQLGMSSGGFQLGAQQQNSGLQLGGGLQFGELVWVWICLCVHTLCGCLGVQDKLLQLAD